MPDNFSQWTWFYFFFFGAAGGWAFMFIMVGSTLYEGREKIGVWLKALTRFRVRIVRDDPH